MGFWAIYLGIYGGGPVTVQGQSAGALRRLAARVVIQPALTVRGVFMGESAVERRRRLDAGLEEEPQ